VFTPKFNYQPIPRETVNGRRLYATPDGKKLPSVTTILEATKPAKDKQALQAWRNYMGPARAQAITTEAANRGTRMHKFLEDYIKTGKIAPAGTNPFSQQSHVMAAKIIDQGLCHVSEVWGFEVPLYYAGIYAGTTDAAGIHLSDASILDYKQTNKPKPRNRVDDYFLQLCAYAEAHNQLHGTCIKKGVILMCVKPEMDDLGTITTQPVYQEFVLQGAEFEQYRQQWWQRVEQYYLLNTL
jgi:genome maintenance exonuclease 1